MVKVGEQAPDFELLDQDRKPKKLAELKGKKVVLAFFPGAFTSVCTKEMCAFRDGMSRFNELDAIVLGISVNDPFTLKAFAEQNKLNFTLLSDYMREVSRRYGGVHEDFIGMKGYSVAKRAVFVLDRQGIVRYAWVSDNPLEEPSYDEVKRVLERIN
ncbi:MAG: peroxiredoxin [Thaumarchaeota archaeon]|nr:peroxiredoxin [Candidatus Calditenuaceae archaeon]MDW8187608.1 peroxiredoxin [Nitrososphaerota archaeon]